MKKIIFGIVAGLFAVATVFNMSMLNDNGVGDVSLDAVEIMAQAEAEVSGSGKADTMAYCSSCGYSLCTACTTKYNHGCSVYENCTVSN